MNCCRDPEGDSHLHEGSPAAVRSRSRLARMAWAKRQRQARPILCEREAEVAETFAAVGVLYRLRPTALHRRGIKMHYETMRSAD